LRSGDYILIQIKLYLTEYHTKDTIADVMPIKDIKLAVTVQLTQIEKHKKIIEEILQGLFSSILTLFNQFRYILLRYDSRIFGRAFGTSEKTTCCTQLSSSRYFK